MSDTVTLHCQAGNHEWQRPKQRGKRPFNCPEHSVVRESSGLSREESQAAAAAERARKAAKALAWEHRNLYPLVRGNDGGYAGDAPRVLEYIDRRLAGQAGPLDSDGFGGNDGGDTTILTQQRDRILKRARETFSQAATA